MGTNAFVLLAAFDDGTRKQSDPHVRGYTPNDPVQGTELKSQS